MKSNINSVYSGQVLNILTTFEGVEDLVGNKVILFSRTMEHIFSWFISQNFHNFDRHKLEFKFVKVIKIWKPSLTAFLLWNARANQFPWKLNVYFIKWQQFLVLESPFVNYEDAIDKRNW